ncbi:hypothetical protein [Pollutibacter soli]|uniref:hypothetical protein n=1 Tax=Pollutibacter soli TaxID=3034157 RepID=UPI003013EADC
MKKLGMALIAIVMIGASVTSCKKEKTLDCNAVTKKVSDAASAYVQSQSSTNCKNYKAALQEYFNSECYGDLTAEEKEQYQTIVDMLSCPE